MSPGECKKKCHNHYGVLGKMLDVINTSEEERDSYISLDEIKAFAKSLIAPEMSEAEVLHAFQLQNTGTDGKITHEEFT